MYVYQSAKATFSTSIQTECMNIGISAIVQPVLKNKLH